MRDSCCCCFLCVVQNANCFAKFVGTSIFTPLQDCDFDIVVNRCGLVFFSLLPYILQFPTEISKRSDVIHVLNNSTRKAFAITIRAYD